MERIRLGNNIAISWALYDLNGRVHSLEDKEVQLYMSCGGLKQAVTDYTIQGNVVSWVFLGTEQKKVGLYKLILVETDALSGAQVVDVAEAFRLVSETLSAVETGEVTKNVSVRSVLTYSNLVGVESVDVVESSEDGGTNLVSIHLVDGNVVEIPIKNGSKGDTGATGATGATGPKGDKGDIGERGPVGIDSVEASIGTNDPTQAPSVDKELAEGVLSLTFNNIKGAKGDKGDQGNTGSSVDYPYELVNNVTTDDATKGLSAAQGVVLDGKIGQLGQEVSQLGIRRIFENPVESVLENLDAIKDIFIIGADPTQKIHIRDIWKNYPNSGDRKIFLYYTSPYEEAISFISNDNANGIQVLDGDLNKGGKIRLTINWDEYPNGYMDWDYDTNKNVIKDSMFYQYDDFKEEEYTNLNRMLYNPVLPQYLDAIKDIFIIGADSSKKIHIRDIWKNYLNSGDRKIFLYYTNPYEEAISFISNDNANGIQVLEGELSKGGKIRLTINWDDYPNGYMDWNYDTNKNVIKDSMFYQYGNFVRDEYENLHKMIENPALPQELNAIKDIFIIGADATNTIHIRDIWKNYPNSGDRKIFLYYTSPYEEAISFISNDNANGLQVLDGDLNKGGKVRLAINWDECPDGYMDWEHDTTKNVISKGCYYQYKDFNKDITLLGDDSYKLEESALRDAIFAQDSKMPFAWGNFDKAYITLMNDGCRDDMNSYRLECEQRGVPYVCTYLANRMNNELTFTDVDGNGVFVCRKPRIGVEYQKSISGFGNCKIRLYADVRSQFIGEDITLTVKSYTSESEYTTQQLTFSSISAGKTYKDINLSGIVKVGIILSTSVESTFADYCNFMVTPYEQSANNVTKKISEIAKIIYNNFGENMLHGTDVINSIYDDVAEEMMYEQTYINKVAVEDSIGIHCIKGFIPIGGPNSDFWNNTEKFNKFALRQFLYGTNCGLTPQYNIPRNDFNYQFNNIAYCEVSVGLLQEGKRYFYDATHYLDVIKITTASGVDKILAKTNNYTSSGGYIIVSIPSSGTLYTDNTMGSAVGAFSSGRMASAQEIASCAELFVQYNVMPKITNKEWLVFFCHSEYPSEFYGALIDVIKNLSDYDSNIAFTDWYDMFDKFKSHQV